MVEPSGTSKRSVPDSDSSPPPNGKRSKAAEAESSSTLRRELQGHDGAGWGRLISLYRKNPHILFSRPAFTVSVDNQRDLCLRDPSGSSTLCILKNLICTSGDPITLLEVTGGKGLVQLNIVSTEKVCKFS